MSRYRRSYTTIYCNIFGMDIKTLISTESPDVLFITETPYDKDCSPLCNMLRNQGYYIHFRPTKDPVLPSGTLAEARIPSANAGTNGGCMRIQEETTLVSCCLPYASAPRVPPRYRMRARNSPYKATEVPTSVLLSSPRRRAITRLTGPP